MMENKLKKLLSVILDVDEKRIDDNTSADNIKGWDSLKQMNIIVALEEEFDIRFDEDESILSNSYISLLDAIKKKSIKRNR